MTDGNVNRRTFLGRAAENGVALAVGAGAASLYAVRGFRAATRPRIEGYNQTTVDELVSPEGKTLNDCQVELDVVVLKADSNQFTGQDFDNKEYDAGQKVTIQIRDVPYAPGAPIGTAAPIDPNAPTTVDPNAPATPATPRNPGIIEAYIFCQGNSTVLGNPDALAAASKALALLNSGNPIRIKGVYHNEPGNVGIDVISAGHAAEKINFK